MLVENLIFIPGIKWERIDKLRALKHRPDPFDANLDKE